MTVQLLLLINVIIFCSGDKLTPTKYKDILRNIHSLYIAEWQWEAWPVKQELMEQNEKQPRERQNIALWRDNPQTAWYLFGGQSMNGDPKKKYSDIWKFTIQTRVWKRIFPVPQDLTELYSNENSEKFTLETDPIMNISPYEIDSHRVVMCGGLEEKNITNSSNQDVWSSFGRNTFKEEKNADDLRHLAIYAPKSHTVWQLDVKNKRWKTYDCDLNNTENETEVTTNWVPEIEEKLISVKDPHEISNSTNNKNESSVFDSKINKAEDKAEVEEQHLNFSAVKNKKKKINQIRKINEKLLIKIEKEKNINETKLAESEESHGTKKPYEQAENRTKINTEKRKDDNILKPKQVSVNLEKKSRTPKSVNVRVKPKNCPNIPLEKTSMSWCDGKNEAFITLHLNISGIIFQVFNLKTGVWSEIQEVSMGEEWEGCPDLNSIRYAGTEEELYVICSLENVTSTDLDDRYEIPPYNNYNIKLIYKINYKERRLYNMGKVRFNPIFNSQQGKRLWQNEFMTFIQVFKNFDKKTVLIVAYRKSVDFWTLERNEENKEIFELAKNIWRGSALKLFGNYNGPLYSLQFVSESENSETVLILNPRGVNNDYWPRERGRFKIRIFKNDNYIIKTKMNEKLREKIMRIRNMKYKSRSLYYENRTKDQNLSYELYRYDYNLSGREQQFNQTYALKVLVFFGISLAIFVIFGLIIFLKKCVSCPPRIHIRNECNKSSMIIRYSVIPDDLLYPVA